MNDCSGVRTKGLPDFEGGIMNLVYFGFDEHGGLGNRSVANINATFWLRKIFFRCGEWNAGGVADQGWAATPRFYRGGRGDAEVIR